MYSCPPWSSHIPDCICRREILVYFSGLLDLQCRCHVLAKYIQLLSLQALNMWTGQTYLRTNTTLGWVNTEFDPPLTPTLPPLHGIFREVALNPSQYSCSILLWIWNTIKCLSSHCGRARETNGKRLFSLMPGSHTYFLKNWYSGDVGILSGCGDSHQVWIEICLLTAMF